MAPADHYYQLRGELDALVKYAVDLLNAQAGFTVQNQRENYGEKIFGKMVCHAISLQRLLPAPDPANDSEIWDVSSAYAVARTILESYEAFAYIAIEPLSDDELGCRISAWHLHAQERRLKMLSLIGSEHPQIEPLRDEIADLRKKVLSQPYSQYLRKDVKAKIEKGETPSFITSRDHRLNAAGVSPDYFNVALMQLSSHVHTHPFSVLQLLDFHAGSPEAYGLMTTGGRYAFGFLSAGIRDMSCLFSPRVPKMPPGLKEVANQWCEILKEGVRLR